MEAEDCVFAVPAVNKKLEGSECSCLLFARVHMDSVPDSVRAEKMKALWCYLDYPLLAFSKRRVKRIKIEWRMNSISVFLFIAYV